MKETRTLGPTRLPDPRGWTPGRSALLQPREVAHQMCPAELAPLRRVLGVGTVAVTPENTAVVSAQEPVEGPPGALPCQAEERGPACTRPPGPVALPAQAPARLVHLGDRGRTHGMPDLPVGAEQRLARLLQERVHGSERGSGGTEQIAEQIPDLPPRQTKPSGEQRHEGTEPGPDRVAVRFAGKRGPSPRSAAGTRDAHASVLRDFGSHRGQLRDLPAHRISCKGSVGEHRSTAAAASGAVLYNLIHLLGGEQRSMMPRMPRMPRLAPALPTALRLRETNGAGRIGGGRQRGIRRVHPQAGAQLTHLRLECGNARLQREDRGPYGGRENFARRFQLLDHAHASPFLHLQCRAKGGLNGYLEQTGR